MLSVDSAEFRQRAPRVMLSDDPDTATAQTVAEMCRQIRTAASDPLVQACAVRAVQTFKGGPGWAFSGVDPLTDPACMAESCWFWCKWNLKFRHHGSMFEMWSRDLGDPRTKLQLLISPDVLVRMKRMEGDCAIYTMMLAAMLRALGIHFEICTAAVDARQPDIFSHVWPRVVLPGGREALDASHGAYPGWQVPDRDIYRLKIWDEGGREVGQQAQRFNGLHAYRARGLRGYRRGMGDGVDPETGESYGTDAGSSTTYVDYTSGFPASPNYSDATTGAVYSGPVYTAPAQNSAAYATFASNLVKAGLTLAEINSIQPGTVVSANGAILRQNPGYAVGSAAGTLNLGSGSSSLLMVGGLVIAGLFALSMFKK